MIKRLCSCSPSSNCPVVSKVLAEGRLYWSVWALEVELLQSGHWNKSEQQKILFPCIYYITNTFQISRSCGQTGILKRITSMKHFPWCRSCLTRLCLPKWWPVWLAWVYTLWAALRLLWKAVLNQTFHCASDFYFPRRVTAPDLHWHSSPTYHF